MAHNPAFSLPNVPAHLRTPPAVINVQPRAEPPAYTEGTFIALPVSDVPPPYEAVIAADPASRPASPTPNASLITNEELSDDVVVFAQTTTAQPDSFVRVIENQPIRFVRILTPAERAFVENQQSYYHRHKSMFNAGSFGALLGAGCSAIVGFGVGYACGGGAAYVAIPVACAVFPPAGFGICGTVFK